MPVKWRSATSDTAPKSRRKASQKQASVAFGRRSKIDAPLGVISIELERGLVVLLQRRVLLFLPQEAVAHRQRLDLRAHEAAERILGGPYDRLAAHVEAGVDDHGAAGQVLELRDQLVVARVRLAVHGL